MFGTKWFYNFINESDTLTGDTLLVGKFKLLTDSEVNDIMQYVENTKGRTFIYFTVSQETAKTNDIRLKALQRLKELKPSKIVIIHPFENDLTVMGSKKYVSYIPDILLRLYERYPSADIKNIQTELSTYSLNDMFKKAIENYKGIKEKKKTVETMKTVNILPTRNDLSDNYIKQLIQNGFNDNVTILKLDDLYNEYKKFYSSSNSINESITYRDLNKQYVRDDFVLFTLMRNTSKQLYKCINVISANFEFDENNEDDYSLIDVSFDVPKNNAFCRVEIKNLLSEPSVTVTNLREITLDDTSIANDLNQFLNIITTDIDEV